MRIPRSTYRIQVNADNPLANIRELIPYLCGLGISDLYISPIYEARAGSTHGYDVTRPASINPEVGTLDDLRTLAVTARDAGMGILLDIVPNHMAATEANPWWRDVLENGRASEFAAFFDVDWQADPPGTGRLLLPVLGQPLADAIAAGEVRAGVEDRLPVLRYHDRSFPLDPATYAIFFASLGVNDAELSRVLLDVPDRENVHLRAERIRNAATARQFASNWFQKHPDAASDPALSHADIRRLHDAQAYSLWYWIRGTRRINYRRFFDISDLAGLRVEDPVVFEPVHALTLPLVADHTVTGLRIDHVDGLRDPAAYLTRLRERTKHTYVAVEKILLGNEELPGDWSTEGTTGYDFIGILNGVFVNPDGYDRLRTWYEAQVESPGFEDMVAAKKRLVIDLLFDGEARDLAAAFVGLAARMGVTLQEPDALDAIAALTASLPVYRTYISERGVPDESQARLLEAKSRIEAPAESLDLLVRMLLLQVPREHLPATVDFAMRWQQFTGPVMAKGLEDTSFYNYNALISLCEVGTWPPSVPGPGAQIHTFLGKRQDTWPHAMNASSTHDTKRSEDVRARINVLSELADEWIAFIEDCFRGHDRFRKPVHGLRVPTPNEQILLYQTVVGAWPIDGQRTDSFRERISAFMLKALREAKAHTSWSDVHEDYESAVLGFCDAILSESDFDQRSHSLRDKVAYLGALNSLSQLMLKLGAPGIPDFYQGTETWDLSLVDPDNRRPVDYVWRKQLAADTRSLRQMLETWQDGAIKIAMTRVGLELRNNKPALFVDGSYEPLDVRGPLGSHIVAFARRLENDAVVFATTRWFSRLSEGLELPTGAVWEGTSVELPMIEAAWRNILTDQLLPARDSAAASDLFSEIPYAILVADRQPA